MKSMFGFGKTLDKKLYMDNDPDIRAEASDLPVGHPPISDHRSKGICPFAKLNVVYQSHRVNDKTAALVEEIGGLPALRRFTTNFYKKAFADPHLDQFIRSHDDPHGERFALWIAEKMSGGTPWSDERRTRPHVSIAVGNGYSIQSPHDRSSAHYAAWHSPKRDSSVWGQHFKLDDCRVWMRLHFWAAREEGVLNHPGFADYYCRFIGHFVSVYEGKAPPFARESMRWSADPENIKRYLDAGRRMPDIMGMPTSQALASLPPEERTYHGSSYGDTWPYEQR